MEHNAKALFPTWRDATFCTRRIREFVHNDSMMLAWDYCILMQVSGIILPSFITNVELKFFRNKYRRR